MIYIQNRGCHPSLFKSLKGDFYKLIDTTIPDGAIYAKIR